MGLIYKERQMDYFVFDTVEQVNAKAAQLILEDKYDFYAVYNGNYDTYMHKFAPRGNRSPRGNKGKFPYLWDVCRYDSGALDKP